MSLVFNSGVPKHEYLRDVQIHRVVTFPASAGLQETGSAAFDLDLAPRLLLDMLDIRTALSNNLRTEVESLDGFHTNGDFLLRPFTLHQVSKGEMGMEKESIRDHIHPARMVQVLGGGTVVHPLGWAAPFA